MADSGVVVVPTPESSVRQQQQQQDEQPNIDRVSIAHRITTTATTNSPLQPILDTNQQYTNSNNSSNNHTITYDELQTVKPVATLNSEHVDPMQQSNNISKTLNIDFKPPPPPLPTTAQASEQNKPELVANSCGSSQQLDIKPSGDLPDVSPPKKKGKYEETIIDGFAICAFKSWEDLQDEINEKIALERANKDQATSEKSSSDINIKKEKKKKSKSKLKDVTSLKPSCDESGSVSQARVSKSKVVKKDKKVSVEKILKKKKSSNEHSAGSTAKINDKKHKERGKVELGRDLPPSDRKPSSLPRSDIEPKIRPTTHTNVNGNSDQINPSGSTTNHQNSPHTSQSPKVHHPHENLGQELRSSPQKITQESIHKSNQSRAPAPYPPYGNNSLSHRPIYDVTTSKDTHTIQNHPHPDARNQNEQSGVKQNISQPKQVDPRQTTPQHAIPPPPAQSTQSQMPYHQSPSSMYHPPPPPQQRPLSPNMNHGMPPYSHPLHQRPPNPYFHPYMGPNHAQAPSNQPLPSFPSHYQPQQPHTYPSPYHPPNQPPYYPHDGRNSHMTPHPFHMYPPHPSYQPQHSSSVVSSVRTSSLPPTYGSSPYIITDTTISRQTSIVPPPMPTALEQAAASSVASRYGHHPSTIHSMNHYNATAAAAAAAAVAAQSHTQSSSLFQSTQSHPEKNLSELARSYGGTSVPHPATSSYPNPANAAYPPSSTGYTNHPYGLDRWPRMAIDHQQAVSSYNSLYQTNNPSQADRSGSLGGHWARAPPFHAGMFPPPPF